MKVVDDARTVWRHYSTLALTTIAGLGGVWATVPDDIKALLPHWVGQGVAWCVFGVAVLGIGGKFIDQTPKDKP
jgi:hypothetical protein